MIVLGSPGWPPTKIDGASAKIKESKRKQKKIKENKRKAN
jgi:hypothetical protein